jgi:PAS domain S-box-containing protein
MLEHEDIWRVIDELARRHGLTPSGLARRAGLDSTTFNKSKRIAADGHKRWPSTESLAKAMKAVGATFAELSEVSSEQPGGVDAFRASETKFRMLAEGSIQGIVVHRDFRPLFVNQAYANIFGYGSPNEVLTEGSVMPVIASSERDRMVSYNKLRFAGEAVPTQFEFQGLRKDGTLIWLETRVEMVDWDGEAATQCMMLDITERKKADEALRLHTQIVDQIHDSVVSTDRNGIITTWNKGAERLFGYTSEQAVGRHISFVYPEEEREYLETQVIEPTERKGWHETNVRMRRKSGEIFHAQLSDSVLRNAQGEIVGRIGYSIDITERIRAEKALREVKAQAEAANRS